MSDAYGVYAEYFGVTRQEAKARLFPVVYGRNPPADLLAYVRRLIEGDEAVRDQAKGRITRGETPSVEVHRILKAE